MLYYSSFFLIVEFSFVARIWSMSVYVLWVLERLSILLLLEDCSQKSLQSCSLMVSLYSSAPLLIFWLVVLSTIERRRVKSPTILWVCLFLLWLLSGLLCIFWKLLFDAYTFRITTDWSFYYYTMSVIISGNFFLKSTSSDINMLLFLFLKLYNIVVLLIFTG